MITISLHNEEKYIIPKHKQSLKCSPRKIIVGSATSWILVAVFVLSLIIISILITIEATNIMYIADSIFITIIIIIIISGISAIITWIVVSRCLSKGIDMDQFDEMFE